MGRLQRVWNTFRPDRVQGNIDRELAFHIAERTDQLRSEGLSDEEAARRARRQFGNVTVQSERTRDVDLALWADGMLRNVRYAAACRLTIGIGSPAFHPSCSFSAPS
jgi:putative ABC transport system permease protein